jgi:hypothetical protein
MKLRVSTILAAVSGVLLSACSSLAPAPQSEDARYGPSAGESSLSFSGNLSKQSVEIDGGGGADVDLLTLQLGVGKFLSDTREWGGQISVLQADADGETLSTLGITPYYRINVRTNDTTWFYYGLQGGLAQAEFGDDSESSFSYGIHGGYKSWIRPDVAVFVEPQFNKTSFDAADVDEFRILFGLTVVF